MAGAEAHGSVVLWNAELFIECLLLVRLLCHADGRPKFESMIAMDILIQAFQLFGQRAHWFGLGAHTWYVGAIMMIPLMYMALAESSQYHPILHRKLLFWWISLVFACSWVRIFPHTNTVLLTINLTFFCLWIADSFSKTDGWNWSMQRGDITLRMRAEIRQSESPETGAGGLDAGPSGRDAGLDDGKEVVGKVRKGDKITSMNSFWKGFIGAILNGALQGGAAASQSGQPTQGIGITAGIGALAGILQYLTQHPVTAPPAPVTTAAISAVNKTTVIPPAWMKGLSREAEIGIESEEMLFASIFELYGHLKELHENFNKGLKEIMAGISDIKTAQAAEKADLATLTGLIKQLLAAFAAETLSPADAQNILDEMTAQDVDVKSSISTITAALPPVVTTTGPVA